jgi:hypothetical protein
VAKTEQAEKRPRGRPPSGKLTKRTKTFTLAADVCEYLATTGNQSAEIEDAIRLSRKFGVYMRAKKSPPVRRPVQGG